MRLILTGVRGPSPKWTVPFSNFEVVQTGKLNFNPCEVVSLEMTFRARGLNYLLKV